MRKISNVFFSAVLGFIMASVTGVLMLAPIVAILLLLVVNHLPKGILAMSAPAGDDPSELEKRFENKLTSLLHNFKSGIITAEAFELRMSDLAKDIEKRGLQNTELEKRVTQFQATIEALEKTIDKLGEDAKAGIQNRNSVENIKDLLTRDIFGSETYKKFIANPKGRTDDMELRLSITSDYTGAVLLSKIDKNVVQEPFAITSIRMLLERFGCVIPTPKVTQIVAPRIESWTDGTDTTTENGTLGAITFKAVEKTWTYKRLGNKIQNVSNTMLESADYIMGVISAAMPRAVKAKEDHEMLHGDNSSTHLKGMIGDVTEFSIDGPSFVAGKVASIATWASGTKVLVTFTEDHKLRNYMNITFASATASKYNTTFKVNIISSKQIVLDVSYTAEAVTSAWTATSASVFKNAVDNANEVDVLIVAGTMATLGYYAPNAVIINPAVTSKISMLKTAVEFDYLDLKGRFERRGNQLYLGSIPVVESTEIGVDDFIIGNFAPDTIQLCPVTALSVIVAADVADIEKDQVQFIASEKLIFPILNPFVIMHGKFSTAKTALETA